MPTTAPGLVARARDVLRDQGPRVFWLKVAGMLGYRRMLLLAAPIGATPAVPASALHCGFIDAREVEAYLAFRPEASGAESLARWREGDVCAVARDGAHVVACVWARTRVTADRWMDYKCPLAPAEIYLYDAHTRAASRGRGIAPALCAWLLAELARSGYRRALRGPVVENTAGLRAHAKCGFQPIAVITRVRLGPWRRTVRREIA